MTILDSDEVLKAGLRALAAADPLVARLIAEGAVPVLRRREPGFEELARILIGQQLSTGSASAIWSRLKARFPELSPRRMQAASDQDLRSAGLSGPKARALRAVATAILDGTLPLGALSQLSADEAHAALVQVTGIGPWTAEVYLLFGLGYADAFPVGDLALQEAARIALAAEERPSAAALRRLAESWRPWRGVAAHVLWAYYRIHKRRPGAPVALPDRA